jgi:transposase-like protein
MRSNFMVVATTNCPLCKSNNIRERAKVGAFFKVWRCRECTFAWVDRSDLARPEAAPSYQDRDYQKTGRYGPLRPPYVINGFNQVSIKELYRRFGLTPTWISTSYMGTSVVPYAPNFTVKVLGLAGSLFGKGSMLIAEAKPITSVTSSNHE